MADILIIDDEKDIREIIAAILEDEGFETRTAFSADSALKAMSERKPSLIFLDIWLQGSRLDGLELLEEVKPLYPDVPIVMISGHGTIETAVSAIKHGAFDYIEKPFNAERLIHIANRALEHLRLTREVKTLQARSSEVKGLVGNSLLMQNLRNAIDKIAPTNSRVMIMGEAGTGKEFVARTLHQLSPRAKKPFVIVNAATITPESMEEALFGVENPRQIGALEEAHNGTIYLDEIADMPKETQAKILRVLTDQSFSRAGSSAKITVDVRVISSTSRDPLSEIAQGNLREDLYHRLCVVPLQVPSLKSRIEDLPLLVAHFQEQLAAASGLTPREIGEDVLVVLQSHSWPGNVRQLKNNIERLLILAGGAKDAPITIELLPPEIGADLPSLPSGQGGEYLLAVPLREARELFEKDYLLSQLNRFGGNISKTAEFIGMERSALHRKLKLLGVN
jgi:two-component system, NtrC family, nitrogen regulation response regulator NtrX